MLAFAIKVFEADMQDNPVVQKEKKTWLRG